MSHRAAWFAAVLVAGLLVAGGFNGVREAGAARAGRGRTPTATPTSSKALWTAAGRPSTPARLR